MLAYWLLFLLPAFQAVSKLRPPPLNFSAYKWSAQWRIVFVLLVSMIGLRHQVGGDWGHYLGNLEALENTTIFEALAGTKGDPANSALNWIANQLGLGIYLVNFVYAIFFTWGLLLFCRNQPRPWLALTVAVPYLITVGAMGYSRQGLAIGLIMMGFVFLENKKVLQFVLCVALAATFHKSAVIVVPLAALASTERRLLMLFWIGLTSALLFALLLQEHVDALVAGYIIDQYESTGAAIRIYMNALPAALFLILRKRFQLAPAIRNFWTWMAWGALAFVALLYISPSSTAVDRLALYWIPLQLFVWSRIPNAMGRSGPTKVVWVYAVVAYSAAVHFVWLSFSTHSYLWLPYQFYPWVWLWN
jgi:hypothetical protein